MRTPVDPAPHRRTVLRPVARVVLVLLLGLTACTSGGGDGSGGGPSGVGPSAGDGGGGEGGGDRDTVEVELPQDAVPASFSPLSFSRVSGPDRIATAIAVSREHFTEADTAIIARADAFADALAAAPLATELSAPVLLSASDELSDGLLAELERLGVDDVVLLGGEAALSPQVATELEEAGLSTERIAGQDRYATAVEIASRLPETGRVYVATGSDFPDALAAGAAAARLPAPLLLVDDDLGAGAAEVIAEQRPSEALVVGGPAAVAEPVVAALEDAVPTVERLSGADRYATAAAVHDHVVADFGGPAGVWLASADGFADALAAGPVAAAQGATLLLAAPVDMADADATVETLGEVGGPVTIAGGPAAVPEAAPLQVQALLAGNTLPGGGTVLFPTHRMVAYYGNAEYAALGVLGETTPQEAVARVEEVAAQFEDGERPVMPAFELIVTIATAAPGQDGNYSAVGDLEDVREYVEVARENGFYLFLDFQPGRNPFIDQVKLFEEFLREPHVGVALDPEWRMTPDQRPGEVIGSVDATEVNEVAEYVAGIVREENLPQKLFVVHQFRTSMIRNREELITPPELAVTIHVDGFGNQELKLETWGVLADADSPFFYGFKLFYDEDTNLFAPAQVVDFTSPAVDLVTYQ